MKPVAVWARPFDDPILLPGGREILTLRDAGDYSTSLAKAEQLIEEWQAAVEALRWLGGAVRAALAAAPLPLPARAAIY